MSKEAAAPPGKRDSNWWRAEAVAIFLIAFFLLGLGCAELSDNLISPRDSWIYWPYSLGIWLVLMTILLNLYVYLHELAHALTANWVGYPVYYIEIGRKYNRVPVRFHFLGYQWSIYSFIRGGGRVGHGMTSVKDARKKLALIIMAGPLTNLGLLLVVAALHYTLWQSTYLERDLHPYYILFCGATFSLILINLQSLYPWPRTIGGKTRYTDMNLLLKTLKYSDVDIEGMVAYSVSQGWYNEMADPAIESAEEATAWAEREPDNLRAQFTALARLETANPNDDRLMGYLRKILAMPSDSPKLRYFLLDRYLTMRLQTGTVSADPACLDLSRELYGSDSGNISLQGTHGAILIDTEHIEEGGAMLQQVLATTKATIDKSFSNIFLALARKRAGDFDAAHSYAAEAARVDPACPALKRISDLLPSSLKTSPTQVDPPASA